MSDPQPAPPPVEWPHPSPELVDCLVAAARAEGRREGRAEMGMTISRLAEEIVEWAIRPSSQYAYDRCRFCGLTWWGRVESNPEPERHNWDCFVPRLRAHARTGDEG